MASVRTTIASAAPMTVGIAARWAVTSDRTKNAHENASRRNRTNTAAAAMSGRAPVSAAARNMAISMGLVGTKN
jgi:hypothetical protein